MSGKRLCLLNPPNQHLLIGSDYMDCELLMPGVIGRGGCCCCLIGILCEPCMPLAGLKYQAGDCPAWYGAAMHHHGVQDVAKLQGKGNERVAYKQDHGFLL